MKGEVVVEGVERERCSCSWYGEGEVRLGECQTSEDDEEREKGLSSRGSCCRGKSETWNLNGSIV